ncbi:MAG TPA: AsmA family protein, partial [Geobacteraceae bacterium]|nr:AsmA family protein [Geobacteraceae bacterium]
MSTSSRRIRVVTISLIVIIALIASAYLLLPRLLDLETYKEQILSEIQRSLNRPVSYSSGKFTFSLGPAFSFDSVVVKEPDNSETFLSAKRVVCRLGLIPLFRRKIVISSLLAEQPEIRIVRSIDGRFNISDLLEKGGK